MLRIVGGALIALGLVVAGFDLVETSGARLRAVGEWWFRLDRDSLQIAQPAIERHLAPWLWDPAILTVLESPAAVALAGLGAALTLLGFALRRVA
ncbi:MAG: hypothetical protein ACFCUS_14860 [Rubrimonas sp.]|uniref:hypothetical protein n=1 Tax=Rubrimonas sp. TaxID=2036015 RepID=UPI002FDCD781